MNSLNGTVETKNNVFENCTVNGFSYAVISDWDIHNNIWSNCNFYDLAYGIGFGTQLLSLDSAVNSGKETGPYNNRWFNCKFNNINKNAVWVKYGKGNASENNSYIMVGTEGAAEQDATDAVIKYQTPGNTSKGDYFSRTAVLSYTPGYWSDKAYVPEIEGSVVAEFGELHVLNNIVNGSSQKYFRLPGEADIASQLFEIEYLLTSRSYSAVRNGIATLTVNGIDKTVTISDLYDYVGATSYETAIAFSALIQDADGDTVHDTIEVLLSSTMPVDDQTQLEFKIRNRKTTIDATGE